MSELSFGCILESAFANKKLANLKEKDQQKHVDVGNHNQASLT
jgi:hypothetical protein